MLSAISNRNSQEQTKLKVNVFWANFWKNCHIHIKFETFITEIVILSNPYLILWIIKFFIFLCSFLRGLIDQMEVLEAIKLTNKVNF